MVAGGIDEYEVFLNSETAGEMAAAYTGAADTGVRLGKEQIDKILYHMSEISNILKTAQEQVTDGVG